MQYSKAQHIVSRRAPAHALDQQSLPWSVSALETVWIGASSSNMAATSRQLPSLSVF